MAARAAAFLGVLFQSAIACLMLQHLKVPYVDVQVLICSSAASVKRKRSKPPLLQIANVHQSAL